MTDSNVITAPPVPLQSTSNKSVGLRTRKKIVDINSFAVGQEYSAIITNVKPFGVFTIVSSGFTIMIPKAAISRDEFHLLEQLYENKHQGAIKVSITSVSADTSSLSGIPVKLKETIENQQLQFPTQSRDNFKKLVGVEIANKTFNATVSAVKNFGIFATLDDYGVEGLIPYSKLPFGSSITAKRLYP